MTSRATSGQQLRVNGYDLRKDTTVVPYSNCLLDLDRRYGTFSNEGATTPSVAGSGANNVRAWVCQATGAIFRTNGTATDGATLGSDGLLYFNGANALTNVGSSAAGTYNWFWGSHSWTWVIVCRVATPDTTHNNGIIGCTGAINSDQVGFHILVSCNGTTTFRRPTSTVYNDTSGNTPFAISGGNSMDFDQPSIIESIHHYNATASLDTLEVKVNGLRGNNGYGTRQWPFVTTNSSYDLQVGNIGNKNATTFGDVYIDRILGYNIELTA